MVRKHQHIKEMVVMYLYLELAYLRDLTKTRFEKEWIVVSTLGSSVSSCSSILRYNCTVAAATEVATVELVLKFSKSQ